MKKLIVIVASLLVAVSAHAQLGVVAGITSSKTDLKTAKEDVKNISQPTQTWDNIKSTLEYGVGLGAGVELIKHVQVSLKYFWNMGLVYGPGNGSDVTIKGITAAVGERKCNGISASVALLF